MVVPAPKIDRRDMDAILKEVRALGPIYVPEWSAASETGAGAALLKIYAKLLEGLIRRLNDVPTKNFIAFLDMLGIKLLPAQPARAPLTFLLSTGAKEAVAVPARSQAAAAPPAGGDPIVYETERAILATPAKLQSFFSVVPGLDQIFDHAATLQAGALAEVFADTNPNQQEHSIYIAHDDLFNIKSAVSISLKFTNQPTINPPTVVSLTATELNLLRNNVTWQYFGERTTIVGQQKQKVEAWYGFDSAQVVADRLLLVKNNADELKQTKINNVKSRWIRGKVSSAMLSASPLVKLKTTTIGLKVAPYSAAAPNDPNTGVLPEAAVFNDIPLDLPPSESAPLLPFGPRPRQGDAFYIASQEAFSKKGTPVKIHIKASLMSVASGTTPITTAALVWEYWNDQGWALIKKQAGTTFDTTNKLSTEGDVSFTCPDDVAPTTVNGVESYWIRVRIAYGDYGQEKVVAKSGTTNPPEFELSLADIHPPQIAELKIIYSSDQPPETAITLNNGEYLTPTASFAPFIALEDARPALYFGFDLPPLKGPISIFFSLTEQEYTEATMPRVEWEYFRQRAADQPGEWTRLLVEDGTANLTVSGTIEFIGPTDFALTSRFGSASFWIRAIDVENKFQPLIKVLNEKYRNKSPFAGQGTVSLASVSSLAGRESLLSFFLDKKLTLGLEGFRRDINILRAAAGQSKSEAGHLTLIGSNAETATVTAKKEIPACDQTLEALSPPFGLPPELKTVTLAPLVKGVYLNTAWASQSETIKDELVGSSSGDANQKYTLTKFPVIEEAIYVNELDSLTESERKLFAEQPGVETEEKKDDKGAVVAFWVRWRRLEDLGEAGAQDRVYTIDQTFGLIEFGDGIRGRVPPIGRDNIRATYQAGGGSAGNVAVNEIKKLRTTIPFVEKATNPEAAGGGSDTELIENTLERAPQIIKNRGRAITAEDFEWLARESSRTITRVKCLPTFNDEGEFETGWVTVIIVPNSTDARPVPSPQLRQRVEKYLSERAANVVSYPKRVRVSAPVYVEVKITADVFPVTLDLAPVVEGEAVGGLQKYLHPLTGGYENRGWEFGRLPCLSDFYALLEAIKGVDHVENLVMTLRAVTPTGVQLGTPRVVTEEKPLSVEMPEYTLLFSGEHKITTKALG